MDSTLKVCVGIVTYNRVHHTKLALESLLQQDYPNLEISVINNASTDSTAELAKDFPSVLWEDSPKNLGIVGGRNHLMSQTDADLFCCIDDDAWFLENDEISVAVDHILKHPKTGVIAFDILDNTRPEKVQRTTPVPDGSFVGCGHVIRLDPSRKIGHYYKFPGSYGCEEKDLCLRMIHLGWDIIKMPGVHVWHDKTMDTRDVAKQHNSGVCNDLTFAFLRSPSGLMPVSVIGKIINHLRFAFWFAKTPPQDHSDFDRKIVESESSEVFIKPALSGIVDFFQRLPSLLKIRQPVSMEAWKTQQQNFRTEQ